MDRRRGGLGSFMECAAVMEHCDLIISSDTSIAHLAGALGRLVFVALKSAPDWRWLLDREDSPWYPSVRLFRQVDKNAWETVFKKTAAATGAQVTEKACRIEHAIPSTAAVAIPGSIGELIDKISILESKESHISDAEKLAHIRHELSLLQTLKHECGLGSERLAELSAELKLVNSQLWDAENAIRTHRRWVISVPASSLARQIYLTNEGRVEKSDQSVP